MKVFLRWIGWWVVLITVTSCLSYRKGLYFNDNITQLDPIPLSESYKLRVRDIIQVRISSPDIEDKVMSTNASGGSGATAQNTNFYFVDYIISDSGNVDLPIIGKINVQGLSIAQADSLITSVAHGYSSLYNVEVRFASFEVQFLGEFKKPGRQIIPNEYCTIYEAIGYGGDLTDYANKKLVKIIRSNQDGGKKIMIVDLTKYDAFTFDNYYIQPHDIIYVVPQKAKVDKQNLTLISFSIGIVSAVYLIVQAVK
ncbi:MAG: polysaccharide biosynthesis/export family protein [Cytophagaceae bacterium]